MAKLTFSEIMAQRQQETHERDEQARAWAAEVTEQLANERCKFLDEFDETQARLFGLIK